jgi:5-methylcytosine-specific restriction endonuclease McrBC regulatory subunit McrC
MKPQAHLFIRENTWCRLTNLLGTTGHHRMRAEWLREARAKSDRIKRDLSLRSAPILIEERSDGLYLKVTGIAGTLRLFGAYQQVAPKFVTEESVVERWQASVLTMLNRVRRKHYTYAPIKGIALTRATFIDHIALAYTDALETALRAEAIHVYKVKEEASSYLRGRLAIARQMQLALVRPQLIQCEVDYLETDNQFNSLLHWAGNRFLALAFDAQVKRKLSATLSRLPPVVGPPAVPVHLPVRPPPQYNHYLEALEIASILARGYGLGSEAGRFAGYGYVLNMEKLFEGFIEKTLGHIQNQLGSGGLTVRAQVSKIYARPVGDSGSSYFTRPDNVVYSNGNSVLLLDAKYKEFADSESGKQRPHNSDVYQLFASMVAHECDRGLLVYPRMLTHEEPAEGEIKLWRISTPTKPLLVGAMTIKLSQLATRVSVDELDTAFAKTINEMLGF